MTSLTYETTALCPQAASGSDLTSRHGPQLDAPHAASCESILIDLMRGARTEHPRLTETLKCCRLENMALRPPAVG
jgi:hypothetical protein